jgi:putative addiction module killer protein
MEVRHYLSHAGPDPFQEWFVGLRDVKARVSILRRIDRLVGGNTGDCRYCRTGVWELRVDVSQGYRVYYARVGGDLVLLLGGGTKHLQQADIDVAVARLKDFRSRE